MMNLNQSFNTPTPFLCKGQSRLFIVYLILFINDVFQLCTNNIDIFFYADDNAILFSADNDAELQAIINTFFSKYATWCTNNCIVINPNKPNHLTFNSSVSITVNDHALSNPPYVKYLGVLFDNRLC